MKQQTLYILLATLLLIVTFGSVAHALKDTDGFADSMFGKDFPFSGVGADPFPSAKSSDRTFGDGALRTNGHGKGKGFKRGWGDVKHKGDRDNFKHVENWGEEQHLNLGNGELYSSSTVQTTTTQATTDGNLKSSGHKQAYSFVEKKSSYVSN